MNKKLIAAAVSAAVVAPVAAYGEVQVYGRINNAIDLNDLADGGDSNTDVSSVSSRFGIKYNKEIGNGLSAHGRYEFSTTTDNEKGINDLRIGTVGVSGPFGRVDIGNQWSSYSNTFGTLISPTYTLGYYLYSAIGGGLFRSSNTIKYSNSFGPVYVGLDIRLNEKEENDAAAEKVRGDGIGLGLSWTVSDNILIAVAFDSEDADDSAEDAVIVEDVAAGDGIVGTAANARGADRDLIGIAAKGTFGGYWVSVGWQNVEDGDLDGAVNTADDDGTIDAGEHEGLDVDTFFVYGGGKFGEKTSWMLGYAEADDGRSVGDQYFGSGAASNQIMRAPAETDDSEQFIWAIYHNLGGGLKIYYEAINLDSENRGEDGARHLLGMRVDF